MATNLNTRLLRLEHADAGSTGGMAATLTEAWRRHREGIPGRPDPAPDEMERMPSSLRGAWQRLIDGRRQDALRTEQADRTS